MSGAVTMDGSQRTAGVDPILRLRLEINALMAILGEWPAGRPLPAYQGERVTQAMSAMTAELARRLTEGDPS